MKTHALEVQLESSELQTEERNEGTEIPNEETASTGNHEDSHAYDKLPHKNNQITRITFININGLPQEKDNIKNKQLFNSIENSQTDIIGLTETNLRWHKLSQRNQWTERTQGMWESSNYSIGYNQKDAGTSTFQPGGTMTISIGKTSHRVHSTGKDTTGLGRWSWTKFRGSQNITLRTITAYRPCIPTTRGPSTVFSQHQRYLDSIDDTRCPREAMLNDLLRFIITCRQEGDQIALLMDCNTDVRNAQFKQRMLDAGLTEAITSNRANIDAATHNRGSKPIDGIFISHTLQIKASGYLPFGDFPSDHRALWIDITSENAFGIKIKEIVRPQARKLKSDDPPSRKKFITAYTTYLSRHKLEERLYALQTRATLPLSQNDANELDQIFALRMRGVEEAESKCRKLRMGEVPYSDELHKASKTIELWKAIETKKKGARYSMSKIRRLEKQLNTHNCLNVSLQEIRQNVQQAYQAYWIVKKDAKNHRLTYLERKATNIAEETGNEQDNVYKQLINREAQRLAARRIRFTLRKLRGGGITRIEVQDQEGNWQEKTTKETIESGCMEENIKKYRQTENTIGMQHPLRNILGPHVKSDTTNSILDGTLRLPTTNQYTQELLHELQEVTDLEYPAPEPIMTTEDFRDGWGKMKERTSSGISGLHFGHMKAISSDGRLSDFEATLAHIPYCTGHVPQLWKKGICCMLKKKPNIDHVTRLRTIVLTEADFNFNNKKLGRDAINHAERNNLIAAEQYGSRKGHSAITHALNKRLSYDIIRQQRRPGALCSNDAKSCYDRVIHSIVALSFKRLGLPEPPVHCMLHCIQQMDYHIRTSHGDSENSFSSTHTEIPFQGILQGNGAAPTIWVLVSTPLLNMLRTAGNGAHIISAISKEPSHIVGFAFVDDTDLITINMQDRHITTNDIMEDMQESIDRWEGGLHTTGGTIVPEKSWVYPIDFKFQASGKWSYKTTEEIGAQFTVRNHNQVRAPLTQAEANDGRCTLGVILAPDGNNKAAITELRRKAETWHDYIRTGHLQANEARLALDSTIMKSLEYPLLALTLTEDECNHIMAPVLTASLTKNHVCRNFPRDVVYGPKSERGLGIKNLYTTKGINQVSALVQYIGTRDHTTGQLIRASIESAKIEMGIGNNIFSYDFNKFHPLLTNTWIKDVWKFMRENEIRITEQVTSNPILRRENDSFIMERIVLLDRYSPAELSHINRCRIHLQATTQADITTGDGLQFNPLAYSCTYDSTIPHPYIWPKQPRPGSHARRLWKKALKLAYPRLENTLIRPLGRWLDEERSKWRWFYNHRTRNLYRRQGTSWRTYHRIARAGSIGRRPKFQYFTQALSLPPHSWRATVLQKTVTVYILTGSSGELNLTRIHPNLTPSTTEERRSDMQEELDMTPEQKRAIIAHLLLHTLRIVSDGSFSEKLKLGTAAWIFAIGREIMGIGRHMTPGEGSLQCSHRSELSGILGAILQMNAICETHNITSGKVELKCDGLGAVETVQYLHQTISPNRKHFDLIISLREALNRSPLTWTFSHVAGHQDDNQSATLLNDWEYLNTVADAEAKAKLQLIRSTNDWSVNRPLDLPYEKVCVTMTDPQGMDVKIGSKLCATMYNHIHTRRIREYWQAKGHFDQHSKRFIDWITPSKAITSLPHLRQKWLSKWITGVFGIGIKLRQWKWQAHSNCPRCLLPDESAQHVLQCPHDESTRLWEKSIESLRTWMQEEGCHQEMSTAFCNALLLWREGVNRPLTEYTNDLVQEACRQQDCIGWYGVFNGFLSRYWLLVVTKQLQLSKSMRSPILWMSRFQKRIWLIPWDQWEHRNNILHNDNALHASELNAINTEVTAEWNTGLDRLPDNRYAHLFRGDLDQHMRRKPHLKQLWLASVWAARDVEARSSLIPLTRNRNVIAVEFYRKWQTRIRGI